MPFLLDVTHVYILSILFMFENLNKEPIFKYNEQNYLFQILNLVFEFKLFVLVKLLNIMVIHPQTSFLRPFLKLKVS